MPGPYLDKTAELIVKTDEVGERRRRRRRRVCKWYLLSVCGIGLAAILAAVTLVQGLHWLWARLFPTS